MSLFEGELITGIVAKRPVLIVHIVKGLSLVVQIVLRSYESLTIENCIHFTIVSLKLIFELVDRVRERIDIIGLR